MNARARNIACAERGKRVELNKRSVAIASAYLYPVPFDAADILVVGRRICAADEGVADGTAVRDIDIRIDNDGIDCFFAH